MRLICPNCDAEYEVDESAIPDGGRDVQCSNCGHAWFQLPVGQEMASAEEEALFGTPPEEPAPLPEPPAPPRRSLDENLMAVLREEAEREAAARRAEAAPIETQTEMPLAAPAPTEAARRVARLKGVDPDAAPPAGKAGSRRQLLPDIEEINSTLRPGSAEAEGQAGEAAATKRGFRSGFFLALLVAVAGAGLYAMAPRLGEQIPGAKPALEAYVAQVDGGRLWLDSAMRRATAAIRGATDTVPSGG